MHFTRTIALAPLLCSCAAIGVYPVGKHVTGTIEDGVYSAPDGSFQVAVPHAERTYEYGYMQVQEQIAERGAFLRFGPAAFDRTVYCLAIPFDATATREAMAAEMNARMRKQFEAVLETGLQQVAAAAEEIAGRPASYARFTQVAPAGKLAEAEVPLTYESWTIDFEHSVACVWVQRPDAETRDEGLEPRAFAASVQIGP